MGRTKKIPAHVTLNANTARQEAENFARARVQHMVQTKCEDIPVFPYGYGETKRAPDWVRAPEGINRDEFIRDHLKYDYLPTRPSQEQLENLYGQLHQFAFSISPHKLTSTRKCNVEAETVVNGKVIPEVKHEGTPVTSFLDHDMKDSYHIIRVYDARNGGRYIEFLRQNSSGYILAWRVFATLDLFRSAVWCYFCDEPAIAKDLEKIWKFVETKQHSTYSVVEDTIFAIETMEWAIDHVVVVYEAPDKDRDADTTISVHFFLLLLGEGPRNDVMKGIIFSTITTKTVKQVHPIGVVFDAVAKNWNKVCKCGCLLRLMIFEALMAAELMEQRPNKSNSLEPHHTLVDLFKETALHERMAQHRCHMIVHDETLQQVYGLSKERWDDGKIVYGKIAYKRIVSECIKLIRYSTEVLALMVREKPYNYPMFIFEKGEMSVKPHAAELLFWREYKSFKRAHKEANKSEVPAERQRQSCLVMGFLCHTIPFLGQWGYSDHVESALSLDEIKLWCKEFITRKRRMDEVTAGMEVVSEWRAVRDDLPVKIKALVDFIGDNDLGY